MRLLCILIVEYRAAVGISSEPDQDTIIAIRKATGYNKSEAETKKDLATMIERGGYYLNLEKHVGQGICFVLGTSLSETHWTKLITKSGPKFDAVLERFKQISLSNTAAPYAILRQRVIHAKLALFMDLRKPLPLDYSVPLDYPISLDYSIPSNYPIPPQDSYYQFGYQT